MYEVHGDLLDSPHRIIGQGGLDWKEVSWSLLQVERNRFASFVVYSLD